MYDDNFNQIDVYNYLYNPDYINQLEMELIEEFSSLRTRINSGEENYTPILYWKSRQIKFIIPKAGGVIKHNNHLVLNLIGYDSWANNRSFDLATQFNSTEWGIKPVAIMASVSQRPVRKLPKSLGETLKAYIEYWAFINNPNRNALELERKNRLQLFDIEEHGRVVSDETWKILIKRVLSGKQRLNNEQRAVIIDNILCCNASAAIEYLPEFEDYRRHSTNRNPRKDGDLLYKACESKSHKYKGHKVYYATANDIIYKTGINI